MKKIIQITKDDLKEIITESINEMNKFSRLRHRLQQSDDGNPFDVSTDNFSRNNPRHMKGYDVVRDWVNYVCNQQGVDERDVVQLLTKDPLHGYHDQESVQALKNEYKNVYYYCVNTLKLRPGVIADIAKCVGEDLKYDMLNDI